MAHFAQLNEHNQVLQVLAVSNEDILDANGVEQESLGIAFLHGLFGAEKIWKQTSYNGNFRKNYAGIGYTYDPERDAFIPLTPYPSWVFNEETCNWDPPVPLPDYENAYVWDETSLNWVQIPESEGE